MLVELSSRVDAADRRKIRLHVSPAGSQVLQTTQDELRQVAQQSLEGLGDDERTQLLALLRRVRANLEPGADDEAAARG